MRLAIVSVASLVANLALAAPADEPMRPEAKALPPVVHVEERVPVSEPLPQSPQDCEAVAPNAGQPPRPYKELKVDDAERTALEARKILFESEKNIPPEEVSQKIEAAVQRFIAALSDDPYNVIANYNLAAAYARIGRNQCSLNLLARVAAMKDFHSRKAAVDQRKEALFGTGKRKAKGPDPDFQNLRGTPPFEAIIKNF
jgi:hypothetical protein